MGLLSFLSKNSRERSTPDIRAQAYHATAQALPPTRGVYPVAGNGRNVFDTLQRSHRMMSETRLSEAVPEASAYALPLSRFNEAAMDRPSSAPNAAAQRGFQRPRTEHSKAPPISLRKPRLVESPRPVSGVPSRLQHHAKAESEPRVVYNHHPAVEPTPAPVPLHSRHISIQTFMAPLPKPSIDILDAQSEIKPSNFKSRVKAAGARDYGEDVADRNLGANGVDLKSAPVQAFHATTPATVTAPTVPVHPASAQPMSSAPFPTIARSQYRDDEELYRRTRLRLDNLDAGMRTRSLNMASLTAAFPSKMAPPFVPRESGAVPQRKKTATDSNGASGTDEPRGRRQAVSTYGLPGEPTGAGRVRGRPTSLNRNSLRTLEASAAASALQGRPKTGYERTSNELGIFAPKQFTAAAPAPPSPRMPRDSIHVNKRSAIAPPIPQTQLERMQSPERPRTARPHSRHDSIASTVFYAPSKAPSKRHSMTSVIGPGYPGEWQREADGRGAFAGRVDVEGPSNDAGQSSPAPSPHVLRSGHARSDSQEYGTPYPRTRSLVSMSGRSRLDEIYEHIPMRTSSLRHWSMTSSTAPSSAASSNPFGGRPQSSHTANTSVDLAKFSSVITSSRSSLDSRAGCGSAFGGIGGIGAINVIGAAGAGPLGSPGLESRMNSPLASAGIYANGGFNIDDYLSSDDDIDADSFVTPRPPRRSAQQEEGLLFREDGYGMGGLQLPGLFDSIPEVPTGSPPSRLTRHSYAPGAGTGAGRFVPKRLSVEIARSFAPGYDYDEDDDLSDADFDDLDPRADLAPGRLGAKRLSALGSYDRIEEESLEKVDVRTAIRLRKEAKARKRMRARRSKGKGVDVVDLDEDHLADVEL